MGTGSSCFDSNGNPQELVCPATPGNSNGGEFQAGDREWHTEQHSYISVGVLNLYLSTTITSGGLLLGIFLGVLVTLGVWFAVHKRRVKLLKKAQAQKEESSKEFARIMATGKHSSQWPVAMRGPVESTPAAASAPAPSISHNQQLVPLEWGQV